MEVTTRANLHTLLDMVLDSADEWADFRLLGYGKSVEFALRLGDVRFTERCLVADFGGAVAHAMAAAVTGKEEQDND